jgi:aryl-alcohol dehydrogenase-like predicted oxidoreductase
MTPRFLENQLGRSLKNLGVECVDVYYLHNPETQLSEIPKSDFLRRVREAFVFLESQAARGRIQYYGVATWNGFRQNASAGDAMQLSEIAGLAKEIAGGQHRFRFVQLPYNLAMTEALTLGNQTIDGNTKTMMEAAGELGITLIASAALLQGQVAQNLPAFVADALGLENDVQRALQFARSSPGIATALVGMSRVAHVEANTRLVGVAPAGIEEFNKLFAQGGGA